MTKSAGKLIIEQKVQDFEKNAAVLKKKGHGETNIRSNYIDVLFEALGWDMKSHYEVDREFSQKDTSGTKKVDYAFKLNGKTKFFIEAKEANVDLVNNKDAIHQAKRYAYSTNGKAPIVILTDFEEFRVFNVMKAPVYDNPNRELLPKYSMEYTDYINNWDLLWDTFSKEAVGNGSLEALRGKLDKNTKTMDVDFLEQITGWRETLARNIAIRNKELKVEELNEAVQRILDRFLFIRNLEDREIEPEKLLLDKTKCSDGIYKSIIPIFRNLDNVYNGLMFKKHFSEDLIIDDKTIKEIIKNMCYPVSPFQFDVIEPEILGRIYEKFLGSKIRLTENHQAKVEEKIEVRKAGGVYYTPEYIVNYIVENTVGKKIEGLTPEEIKKIKIVDPACGSGSFLLGAYSYILAYHEKWYLAHKTDRAYKNDFYITKGGELKVNLDKRGDILRNNLFGVDIDQEATEVAIMSLYLKMLDDGFDKGAKDLFFIKGHVLPDMTNNIKCGNSLIGTDYFDGRLGLSTDELMKVKPFSWQKNFAEVFKQGGFDCVIGNPPYGALFSTNELEYYKCRYKTAVWRGESYLLFIDLALMVLKNGSYLGLIIPDTLLNLEFTKTTRDLLLKSSELQEVIGLPSNIFLGATVDTIILLTKKIDNENKCNDSNILVKLFGKKQPINSIENPKKEFFAKALNWFEQEAFNIQANEAENNLINKMDQIGHNISDIAEMFYGIKCYQVGKGKPKQSEKIRDDKPFTSKSKIDTNWLPFYDGKDIGRFKLNWSGNNWLNYGEWLAEPRKPSVFEGEKILIRKITGKNLISTYIPETSYCNTLLFVLKLKDKAFSYKSVLAVLNSSLIGWYFRMKFQISDDDTFPQIMIRDILQFPIPEIDKKYDIELNNLVDQLLKLNEEKAETNQQSRISQIETKIEYCENKINELVYKLYDLTDEEIKIVEGE